MSAQLVSLMVMFLAGITVGAVIDLIRYIAACISKKVYVRMLFYFIEIVFWCLLGGISFYLLFLIKGGNLRFLDPIAQIIGIFSYDLFFQRPIRFIGRVFVNIIIKPFFIVGHLFVWLMRQMIHFTGQVIGTFGKIFKKSRKRL